MDPPRPSDDSSLGVYTSLLEWMINHGGHLHENVQIAKDETRGVHLKVKEGCEDGLSSNTNIIKTPLVATMSYFNAIDYHSPPMSGTSEPIAFAAHGLHFPPTFMEAVDRDETAILFLIGQYLRGSDGFWHPYIQTLPQPGDLTTPLYYEGTDLRWLEGTSLLPAREERMRLLKERYKNTLAELRKSGFEDVEKYSWELYLWASTIFASRAFSSKVLSSVIPSTELPEENVSVLLPFFDISNHRPMAKVEWQAGTDDVVFVTLENVAAGQEVSNNYGPRNNEQLMMNYGFCLPNNPCDYRILSLRAPPGSPLDEAKKQQRQRFMIRADENDEQYYVFNIFYPLLGPDSQMEYTIFSPALVDAVSILAANGRELARINILQDSIHLSETYARSRPILAALSQIAIELISHIVRLTASADGLEHPSNLKQTHAKMYRDSQILLSRTALVIAAWSLDSARQHNVGLSWEETKPRLAAHMSQIPPGLLSEEVLSRIQIRILERPSLLTKNGELFLADDLRDLLTEPIREPVESFMNYTLTTFHQSAAEICDISGPSPFYFSLFLSVVIAIYRTNPGVCPLPHRLSQWANFLLQKFRELPSVHKEALRLEDQDDEEFVQIFDRHLATLRTQKYGIELLEKLKPFTGDYQSADWWLSPNWMRWAWMISQDETVQVPENPLGMLAAGESGGRAVTLSTERYLYISGEYL
ncbi:hypothetical protein FE257_004138 [Aspergillus nanangensis]|uniref:SET domain-containing protein n=1 Tax=Aspergillus nanangensis TaxID=2582783 RepID=A0AAD4CAU8_ASPNN|nr:hypothetical protein FE257_004138 [Aspergillus nanangensis]